MALGTDAAICREPQNRIKFGRMQLVSAAELTACCREKEKIPILWAGARRIHRVTCDCFGVKVEKTVGFSTMHKVYFLKIHIAACKSTCMTPHNSDLDGGADRIA